MKNNEDEDLILLIPIKFLKEKRRNCLGLIEARIMVKAKMKKIYNYMLIVKSLGFIKKTIFFEERLSLLN